MSRKFFIAGVLIAFLSVLVFVMPKNEQITNVEPGQQPFPVTSNTQKNDRNDGTVVADDETADSLPKQIVVEPTEPTFAQSKPKIRGEEKPTRFVTINNKQYPLRKYEPLALPNDPLVNQWWVGPANFENVWTAPRGASDTLLAVIDSGFALKHEEFEGRLHLNDSEKGFTTQEAPSSLNCSDRSLVISASCNLIDEDYDGIVDNETGASSYENPSRLNCSDQAKELDKSCNRLDDDGNGFIDDVTGWDFINNDNAPQAGELNPLGDGVEHGTMVAGVAAATGNNGKGIAGSDWGTKILPIQALDDDSYGDTLSVGRSIFYAIDQGADVINLSLGTPFHDDYVREAIEAATAAGIVVVAASGNDGCECILYPARYPEVLAVGAIDTTLNYASFSSWGAELDLMAPGTNITSATWSSANPTAAYVSGLAGTSFSAPMVAGIITRMLSHQPSAVPLQLIGGLTENSNRLNLSPSSPHNHRFGFGALNAHKSYLRMTTPSSPFQIYAFSPVQKGSFVEAGVDLEKSGGFYPHYCENNVIPTTPIYELKKSGSHFFSISKVEERVARTAGHTSSLFAYGCVQQPHDNPTLVRTLSIFREFLNIADPR